MLAMSVKNLGVAGLTSKARGEVCHISTQISLTFTILPIIRVRAYYCFHHSKLSIFSQNIWQLNERICICKGKHTNKTNRAGWTSKRILARITICWLSILNICWLCLEAGRKRTRDKFVFLYRYHLLIPWKLLKVWKYHFFAPDCADLSFRKDS